MPPKLLPNGQPLGEPNREPAPRSPPHIQPSHNPTMSHRQQMQPPNRQQPYNAMPRGFLEGFATVVDEKFKRQITPYVNAVIQKSISEAKATMAEDVRKAVREEMKPVILSCRKLGFEIQGVQAQVARLARTPASAPEPASGAAPQPASQPASQPIPQPAPQPAPQSAMPAPGSGPGHAMNPVPTPAPAALPSGSPRNQIPAPAGAMARAPTPFTGPSNAQAGGPNPAVNGAQRPMNLSTFHLPNRTAIPTAIATARILQSRGMNVISPTDASINQLLQKYQSGDINVECAVDIFGKMGLPVLVCYAPPGTRPPTNGIMPPAPQARQYPGGNVPRGPMPQTYMNAPGMTAYAPSAPAYTRGAPAYNPGAPAYNPGAPAYNPGASAYNPGAPAYNPGAPAYNLGAPTYASSTPAYAPGTPAFAPVAHSQALVPVARPTVPARTPTMLSMNQRPTQGFSTTAPAPPVPARAPTSDPILDYFAQSGFDSGLAINFGPAASGLSSPASDMAVKNEPIDHKVKNEPHDGDVKIETDSDVKPEPDTTPPPGPVVGMKRSREDDEDDEDSDDSEDSDDDEDGEPSQGASSSALVLHGGSGGGGPPPAKRARVMGMHLKMSIEGNDGVIGSMLQQLGLVAPRPPAQNRRQAGNFQQNYRSRR